MRWGVGLRLAPALLLEGNDTEALFLVQGVAGEDGREVADRHPPGENFGEDVAEVGRHGEVAVLVEVGGVEAGPLAVNPSTIDPASEEEHDVRVAVVGPTGSVFLYGAAELGQPDEP